MKILASVAGQGTKTLPWPHNVRCCSCADGEGANGFEWRQPGMETRARRLCPGHSVEFLPGSGQSTALPGHEDFALGTRLSSFLGRGIRRHSHGTRTLPWAPKVKFFESTGGDCANGFPGLPGKSKSVEVA
jgi:hypothetical protein